MCLLNFFSSPHMPTLFLLIPEHVQVGSCRRASQAPLCSPIGRESLHTAFRAHSRNSSVGLKYTSIAHSRKGFSFQCRQSRILLREPFQTHRQLSQALR